MIRQDPIGDQAGQQQWPDRLARYGQERRSFR
jgi:hypothetical protein